MDELTKSAIKATLHCLLGCAIGEILGMVIGTAFGLSDVLTIGLAVFLAFFFGYLFSIWPIFATGIPLSKAVKIALLADTASIATMELVDNTVMVLIPGAMEAHLDSLVFWLSLAFALFVAFLVTVPVNRLLIARGKGHAIAHTHHHH